jgi:hypothetical protein
VLCSHRQRLARRQAPGLYPAEVREHDPCFVLAEAQFALHLATAGERLLGDFRRARSKWSLGLIEAYARFFATPRIFSHAPTQVTRKRTYLPTQRGTIRHFRQILTRVVSTTARRWSPVAIGTAQGKKLLPPLLVAWPASWCTKRQHKMLAPQSHLEGQRGTSPDLGI